MDSYCFFDDDHQVQQHDDNEVTCNDDNKTHIDGKFFNDVKWQHDDDDHQELWVRDQPDGWDRGRSLCEGGGQVRKQ